jgi:hypothetical protein
MGISTGKLKMYTINGLKYSAKNECKSMITGSRRKKHNSSSGNRPSDIVVTVYNSAVLNLRAVNPIIKSFSKDLVPQYCQGLESSADYTAPPYSVKFLQGGSNWSLP